MDFALNQVGPLHILAYLEFLAVNVSQSSMANPLSAIKSKFQLYALDSSCFTDSRIKYYNKTMSLRRPFKPNLKPIIDIDMLKAITITCDSMYMGFVYKALYLVSFFSFLRISNLVPHSAAAYCPLLQLARGDIFFQPPGIHMLVKRTTILQSRNRVKILKISQLGSSTLCLVVAITKLLKNTPGHNNSPLFQIFHKSSWTPLIDTKVRRNLKLILSKLKLDSLPITFHSFRHSGATLAFNSNVALQEIQSHSTWTSDCVWRYITQDSNASQEVALAFQRKLLT